MSTAGVSDPVLATIVLAAFFILLALITTARLLIRRDGRTARWRRLRVGVFVERDHDDDDEPPGASE